MLSPPGPPPNVPQTPPRRGQEPFSHAEETILREYLEEFRKKKKEQRKELLMYTIYRLIKAAGPQLAPEEWRDRKKASGVPHLTTGNQVTFCYRKSRNGTIIMDGAPMLTGIDILREYPGSMWLLILNKKKCTRGLESWQAVLHQDQKHSSPSIRQD